MKVQQIVIVTEIKGKRDEDEKKKIKINRILHAQAAETEQKRFHNDVIKHCSHNISFVFFFFSFYKDLTTSLCHSMSTKTICKNTMKFNYQILISFEWQCTRTNQFSVLSLVSLSFSSELEINSRSRSTNWSVLHNYFLHFFFFGFIFLQILLFCFFYTCIYL